MDFDEKLKIAKEKSIVEYLQSRGISTTRSGGKYFASSPFTRDSNWSFCIYPTNTYFDWSTGDHGDIIDLVCKMDNLTKLQAINSLVSNSTLAIYKPNYKEAKKIRKAPFDYTKYLNKSDKECELIHRYAKSRGITEGYYCGVFFTRNNNKWVRNPAMMFLHLDYNLKPCGVKFRKIFEDESPRFSARGNQGLYILENIIEDSFEPTVVYLVESETSANSLWEYTKQLKKSCVVISFGGVSSAPERIPDKYKDYDLRIIIDYDGNEELYEKRIENYSHLNGKSIKLKLDKGEDMNSLYCINKIKIIKNSLYE